ncbi:rubredoxin [Methylolobus aquaticus]
MSNNSVLMCRHCGYLYDESRGIPEQAIPAGTAFDELPENWQCPECGAETEDFYRIV